MIDHPTPYLFEIRKRLWHCVYCFSGFFCLTLLLYRPLFSNLVGYLTHLLPHSHPQLIATEVITPFTVPLRVCFVTSLLLSLTFLAWQLWQFLAPAMYPKERLWFKRLLVLGTILFYIGLGFAFTVVLPFAIRFFYTIAPDGVQPMTDIQALINFSWRLMIAFALAFQTPLITCLLIKSKIVTPQTLTQHRGYVVIAAFTVGMLLTPPDVISQIALAIPLWLLFELGILLGKKW